MPDNSETKGAVPPRRRVTASWRGRVLTLRYGRKVFARVTGPGSPELHALVRDAYNNEARLRRCVKYCQRALYGAGELRDCLGRRQRSRLRRWVTDNLMRMNAG